NSLVRDGLAEHFEPNLDWRECKFCWLGTDKELEAFTFIFRENEHGLFQVHAYPFEEGRSTFIVECREEAWKAAGLDQATEEETVAYMAELFSDHLDGHKLLTNRSIWRTFPTVKNAKWRHGNVILMGDAAHTAHFSIGSGTKLAMEDAIELCDAFVKHGTDDIETALAAYEKERWVDCIKVQKAAQTSLEWFEQTGRYMDQHPLQFSFNLMTRSKRITYDNLAQRDPKLVRDVTEWFGKENGLEHNSSGEMPPPMFAPFKMRDLTLANRIVVSPMCQYSAEEGVPNDWHLVHLGSRAVGGAGLVITEMTNVERDGRITYGCTGLWNEEQEAAWKRVVDFAHARSSSKIAIQLAHAGRKASCSLPWDGDKPLQDTTAWETIGPSAIPFGPGWPTPREMAPEDLERVKHSFVEAARRADRAGFDGVELHMAHGYLLSSFLSPVSNRRTDEYGGSLEKRMRYPLEVFEAVREALPSEKPLWVRVSATDWLGDRGQTPEDTVALCRALHELGCDLVDVSTAGNSPESKPVYGRMYQVPFAEKIRYETPLPVLAVGAIQGWDHANTILAAGRADLCALARPHLADPQLTLRAAIAYDQPDLAWPPQYLAVKPRTRR
ncbi:MAG: FAD-dependent monooxygenase, partial [Planctomycetota bacterium]